MTYSEQETLLERTWDIVNGLFSFMPSPYIYIIFNLCHSRYQMSTCMTMDMRDTHHIQTCGRQTLTYSFVVYRLHSSATLLGIKNSPAQQVTGKKDVVF